MIRYFFAMGPYGWPLMLLLVVNVVLAIVVAVRLADRTRRPDAALANRLNAILFWGAIGMVLGFLGQYAGIYRALHAILGASEISPRIVAIGFAESFTTTLFGLQLFIASAIAWFVLSSRYRKRLADTGHEGVGAGGAPASAAGAGAAS